MVEWPEDDEVPLQTIWNEIDALESNDALVNHKRSLEQSASGSKNEDIWPNILPSEDEALGRWSSCGNGFDSTLATTMVDDYNQYTDVRANSAFNDLCQSTDILDGNNRSFFEEPWDFSLYDKVGNNVDKWNWGCLAEINNYDVVMRDGGSSLLQKETPLDVNLLSPTDMTNTPFPFSMHETLINKNVSVPTANSSPVLQETGKSKGKRKIAKDDADMMAREKIFEKKNEDKKIEEKKATTKSHKLPSMDNEHQQVQQFVKYDDEVRPDYLQGSYFFEPWNFGVLRPQSYNAYARCQAISLNYPQNPVATSRMPKMTSQEKIDKLSLQQLVQKIKEEDKHSAKQFCNQQKNKMLKMDQNMSSLLDCTGKTEECVNDGNHPSELNMTVKKELLHVNSVKKDDYALQEKILHDFQGTIRKLDDNVRLCMKESIFRLARNAMARQCDNNNDRNRANISRGLGIENVILKNETRLTASTNMETNTNPIDRIVAYLLFHNTSRTSNPKEQVSLSSSVPQNLGRLHIKLMIETCSRIKQNTMHKTLVKHIIFSLLTWIHRHKTQHFGRRWNLIKRYCSFTIKKVLCSTIKT